MKRAVCAVLMMAVMATPAFAARAYLKEGGFIQAQRVWKEGGKVHVLATRHTVTSFEPSEVDMKRTFAKKPRPVKKPDAVVAQVVTAAPVETAATQKPVEKKAGISLPSLPKMPEKTPESLVPSSGSGGAIKKHKKEMAEKAGE
jgi:formyltetrahydrofolate synthetase